MGLRIFISYRRSDTQHLAGRIADRLRSNKDIGEVFLDVDGIAPGDDFESKIENAIINSAACLLLIGPNWLGNVDGSARIFDEHDFVRLETRAALENCRRVIPILAEDTKMPQAADLPEELHKLLKLNAIFIRHQHFDTDVKSLHDALYGNKAKFGNQSFWAFHKIFGNLFWAFVGICVAGIALISGTIVHYFATNGQSLNQSFSGNGRVYLLIFGVIGLGAIAPTIIQWLRKRLRSGMTGHSSSDDQI